MCVALPQGDPISLMVIAIAAEVLMVLVARASGDEALSSFPGVLAMQRLSILQVLEWLGFFRTVR